MLFGNILLRFAQFDTRSVAILALTLVGCGGGNINGATPTPGQIASIPTLTSIAITPSATTVSKGQTASLTANGTFSDFTTANITSKVTWSSSNTAVATINSSTGIVTSVAVGNTNIGASFNGIASPSANVSVSAAMITGLSITPATSATPKGLPVTFTATGTYSDGTSGNVSASVTWVSSSAVVATVNNSGIASSLAQGAVTITASANGIISNAATLTVDAPALTAIAINPVSATVAKGLSTGFTATGTYTDATTADITNQVTWTSLNPFVATIVSTTGIATGVTVGSTTVSASLASITSPSVGASVTAAVIKGINIAPITSSIAKGLTVNFIATGTYSDGTTGNVSGAVTWVSSNSAVATVNTTGIASTLATGTTSVSASIAGITSNVATLTVAPAAIASIAISPTTASIPFGGTLQFSTIFTLTDGSVFPLPISAPPCNNIGVPALSWSSSTSSVASVCSTGTATGLAVGSTNIVATQGGTTSNVTVLSVTVPTSAVADTSSFIAEPGGTVIWNGTSSTGIFNASESNRVLTATGTNTYSVADTTYNFLSSSPNGWVTASPPTAFKFYDLGATGWQITPPSATFVNNGNGTMTYTIGNYSVVVSHVKVNLAGQMVACTVPMGSYFVGQNATVTAATCPLAITYPATAAGYNTTVVQANDDYRLQDISPSLNTLTDGNGVALTVFPIIGTRFCLNGQVFDPIVTPAAGAANYNVYLVTSSTIPVTTPSCSAADITASLLKPITLAQLVSLRVTGNTIVPYVMTVTSVGVGSGSLYAFNNGVLMVGGFTPAEITQNYRVNKVAVNAQLLSYGIIPIP